MWQIAPHIAFRGAHACRRLSHGTNHGRNSAVQRHSRGQWTFCPILASQKEDTKSDSNSLELTMEMVDLKINKHDSHD